MDCAFAHLCLTELNANACVRACALNFSGASHRRCGNHLHRVHLPELGDDDGQPRPSSQQRHVRNTACRGRRSGGLMHPNVSGHIKGK